MVKFLKTTKAVIILQGKYAGRKVVVARPLDDGTRDCAYDHWLVAGIKRYPSKVNQAIFGNVRNNGGGHGSASSNSTRSCVASPLDQLASESSLDVRPTFPHTPHCKSYCPLSSILITHRILWLVKYQTDLQSTANTPAILAEIYLGTHDSTNQVAECKDHNPSRPKQTQRTLNHCNGFSGFGYPDPAEAAVVEPAGSAAECCSGQRAESKENSSGPAHNIDLTVLYTETKTGKIDKAASISSTCKHS
ncbi:hypothetical protein SADUNF_Sadunf03G0059300 [Salix dunnii]|uniref:Uncharacterized protein n=1 Tax=Salix dunnii TaxID=1413687 RepID=A0A835KH99_9ROSI|nr:hypothetical protein SADUNF_Sadunf03G0059300 [Salix dunnii]